MFVTNSCVKLVFESVYARTLNWRILLRWVEVWQVSLTEATQSLATRLVCQYPNKQICHYSGLPEEY